MAHRSAAPDWLSDLQKIRSQRASGAPADCRKAGEDIFRNKLPAVPHLRYSAGPLLKWKSFPCKRLPVSGAFHRFFYAGSFLRLRWLRRRLWLPFFHRETLLPPPGAGSAPSCRHPGFPVSEQDPPGCLPVFPEGRQWKTPPGSAPEELPTARECYILCIFLRETEVSPV